MYLNPITWTNPLHINYMNLYMNPTIKLEPDYRITKYLEELRLKSRIHSALITTNNKFKQF